MNEIIRASGALNVPDEILQLAEKLKDIHGVVSIHKEASGIHLHLPDPELLIQDGRKEFDSRHLTINAELYLGIGKYDVDTHPTSENRKIWEEYRSKGKEVPCSKCHKTDKPYFVSQLLMMQPVDKRGLDLGRIRKKLAVGSDGSMNLVDDGTGTMVPAWCGDTVPLYELSADHPAIEYLSNRGFNHLHAGLVYGLCYCKSAVSPSKERGIFYSRAGSLLNTPEGRIIIPIMINGHRMGYQCRLIDKVTAGIRYVWQGGRWNMAGEQEARLHKYMNAVGSIRNAMLFGYDQAVAWAATNNSKTCIIVEGPLDAVRVGLSAVAILGSSMSSEQAKLICSKFDKAVIVGDNDEAGRRAVNKIIAALTDEGMNPLNIEEVKVPEGKDVGGMSYEDAHKLISDKL